MRTVRLLLRAALTWLLLATAAAAIEPTFEIDALNQGLGPASDTLDRSTPQAVMEELLDAAADGDFTEAAHLLNLNRLTPQDQAAQGPALAEQLYAVIDRKVVIDWQFLLERPDALDATASSDSATAGQIRRSLLLWILELDDRSVAIRLDRVQPAGGDPVWVFSDQSVDNIAALYALYGPTRLEQAIPKVLTGDAFWGLMWWEVIGLPLVIALAAIAGGLMHRALSFMAARKTGAVGRDILRSIRTPAILAVVTFVVAICTRNAFVFSGQVSTILGPLIALGFVSAILMFVFNVIDVILDRIVSLDHDALSDVDHAAERSLATRLAAGRRALIILIVLIGGGVVLSQADIFNTLGFSILASAGALTLILGFAAREVLGNIMASMQIALNQSARIGDRILFQGHLCDVERIHFTYVQLRVWTGVRLIVPVSEFISDPFENWTLKEPEMTRLITLKLRHDADVGAMREAFFEIVETLEAGELGDRDGLKVHVTDQDVFGQEVTFCLPCANPNTAWAMACELREKLIARGRKLEEEGRAVFPEATPAEAA
ncbi:mechanosensitive ion channel family protein [Aestuariibius sp. 2305UL40-4]|uniref:mechanosensitive ion channel family protein n=1 Tax=Aestuariibius violaceus TaxID=3234132 RepID=UPI00345E72F9